MPELAQKVKMFFALAPVVTAKHARSPLMKVHFLLDNNLKMIPVRDYSTPFSPKTHWFWRRDHARTQPLGLSDTTENS